MNIEKFPYNPIVEKIVNIMMIKTQNYDPHFFRTQANFFLTLVPSVMNVKINNPITGLIPVNLYAISLLNSGSGKGFSTNILESRVLHLFRNEFMQEVFPKKSALSLDMEANNRAGYLGISPDEALAQLTKEFKSYGAYKFSFDSATTPAIKQLRSKLILSKIGALNLIVDEIGLNLQSNTDALSSLLELYDKGLIRDKLTKNTETSLRFQELVGSTPANMLLFGSPSKLLNGSKVEDDFFDFLETGYARRCFFNFSQRKEADTKLTPEQQYDLLTQQTNEQDLDVIAHNLWRLANINLVGSELDVSRDVGIELIAYRQFCEDRANEMPEYAEIQRSEMNHRYFKALKLAGTYAFIDGSMDITLDHLHQAIRFAEDSGLAVEKLFYREKPYEKLAKFIADNKGNELTQVDIQNELPFYKGSQSSRNEMLNMAIAWGYKNNIILKKSFRDGIEFISGETLEENDLTKCILAYSQSWSSDYLNADGKEAKHISFQSLPQLLTLSDYHWINHYSINGNRQKSDMIEGFNMVVLDVDSGVDLAEVQILLKDYEYIIHTTKRHQTIDPETGKQYGDRFRVILPMNYTVKLNSEEYTEFMKNIADWLPFSGLDEQTFQPNRKWSTYEHAQVFTNQGELLDVTPFIPRTSRNEEYRKHLNTLGSMDNIERWFASKISNGNRNNNLIKYGLMLLDGGVPLDEVKVRVLEFNGKLEHPLDEAELYQTIFKSLDARGVN